MKISDLPKFRVVEISRNADQTAIIGSVSRWQWVGESHIAYLFISEKEIIKGKFRNVNEAKMTAQFFPSHLIETGTIKTKEAYPYFDGYWGEMALLVFDNTLRWQKTDFNPRDAIKHKNDGTKQFLKDGWDHEHCDICCGKISLSVNTAYMKSDKEDNICLGCFENYILKKSIDFIGEHI